MKKFVLSVAVVVIAMALNGCGSSNVPECNSAETTDALTELIKEALYKRGKSESSYSYSGGSGAYELGAQLGAQMATNSLNQQLQERLKNAEIFFDGFTTSNTNEKGKTTPYVAIHKFKCIIWLISYFFAFSSSNALKICYNSP